MKQKKENTVAESNRKKKDTWWLRGAWLQDFKRSQDVTLDIAGYSCADRLIDGYTVL